MKNNIEVVVKNQGVSTEKITPVNTLESGDSFNLSIAINNLVLKYLKEKKDRDSRQAQERIKDLKNNSQVDGRLMRIPESSFQNALLRIVYQHDLHIDNILDLIKRSFAKYEGEDSIRFQLEIPIIIKGVENCYQAVISLEEEMKLESGVDNKWIATNDRFDAQYQIDLISGVEDIDGFIKTFKLVQVKGGTNKDEIESITQAHQAYLDSLPHLVGMLNKKEASMIAENEINEEVIDIKRSSENKEQIALFALILGEYLDNTQYIEDATATNFYKMFKNEGGILSPFTVMGILKNPKLMNNFYDNGDFKDRRIEKFLVDTADDIPYTEEESIAFHKKNHLHTILNSSEIFTVVFEKGKKVSEIKLEFSFNKKSK